MDQSKRSFYASGKNDSLLLQEVMVSLETRSDQTLIMERHRVVETGVVNMVVTEDISVFLYFSVHKKVYIFSMYNMHKVGGTRLNVKGTVSVS